MPQGLFLNGALLPGADCFKYQTNGLDAGLTAERTGARGSEVWQGRGIRERLASADLQYRAAAEASRRDGHATENATEHVGTVRDANRR
jgi:hypothetical protein